MILIFFYLLLLIQLFIFDTPYKYRFLELTKNQTNIFKENTNKYIFSKQYHEHYLSSFEMFKDNKILEQVQKNLELNVKKKNIIFLNLLAQLILIILCTIIIRDRNFRFYLLLLVYIFLWYLLIINTLKKIYYKKEFLNNFQISLIIYFVVSLWPIAPSGNFFNNWLSTIYYFPVGILLWTLRKNKKIYL